MNGPKIAVTGYKRVRSTAWTKRVSGNISREGDGRDVTHRLSRDERDEV